MRDGQEPEQPEVAPGNGSEGPLAEPEYPVDRLRMKLGQTFAGRPIAVYLVLFAGATTLIILLIIVWKSATGGGNDTAPFCTEISVDEASSAVLAGHVTSINVLVDQDNPLETLTGIQLDIDDGTCRTAPQGAANRDDLFRLLGVVSYYNTFADVRVRIHWQRQQIQPELLATLTSTPTATAVPTEAPATPSPLPSDTPTATPTPSPTATATIAATATLTPIPSPTASATTAPRPTATHPPATSTARPTEQIKIAPTPVLTPTAGLTTVP